MLGIVLLTWLSCLKLTLKTEGIIKDIEIDGGIVVKSLFATSVLVQMGYSTGACEVRSQILTRSNGQVIIKRKYTELHLEVVPLNLANFDNLK